MTLADILRSLKNYDEPEFSGQEPTIYAAEPWTANSLAIVSWSLQRGGLPDDAARLRLVCVASVGLAMRLLADQYEQAVLANRLDDLCALLVRRVQEHHIQEHHLPPKKPAH